MARNSKYPVGPSESATPLTPEALTKQDFGRRLHKLLLERGWNQSEFVRKIEQVTGNVVGRDSISNYVGGKKYPGPNVLKSMAETLDIKPEELLPNSLINGMREEHPAIEMRQAAGHPDKVWLRINRMVSTMVGAKIITLISEDDRENAKADSN